MPNANVSRTVAYGGMLAALILVVTRFSAIPIMNGQGYLNLGDVTILFAAALLGPAAAVPAAIGSALADVWAGYVQYAPATFVIKGLVALIAGLFLRKLNVTLPFKIFGMALAELAMATGYLVFEIFLLGPAIALFDLTFNLIQAGVCTLVAAMLLPVAERIRKTSNLN
ncbi:MAG: ECF transporter S component [Clostridia bacterium]|nr:ECF transporter S component [Clostridia bacterium]